MSRLAYYIDHGMYREAIAEEYNYGYGPQELLPASSGKRPDVISVRLGLDARYGVDATLKFLREDCPGMVDWLLWCYAGYAGDGFEMGAKDAVINCLDCEEVNSQLAGLGSASQLIKLLTTVMYNFRGQYLNNRDVFHVTQVADAIGCSRDMFYKGNKWCRMLGLMKSKIIQFDGDAIEQLAFNLERRGELKFGRHVEHGLARIG